MDGKGSVTEVHPEPRPEEPKQRSPATTKPEAKPTKIPRPAWAGKNDKLQVPFSKGIHHSYNRSASAPSSPRRHQPYTPSPLSSPVQSGRSSPVPPEPSCNVDSTKSMPTMPSRIPVLKYRYNMLMDTTSISESMVSSEFSSIADLEGTPGQSSSHIEPDGPSNVIHSTSQYIPMAITTDNDNNNARTTSLSPSMLYPISDSKTGIQGDGPNQLELGRGDEGDGSALTFSTITIPSKGSILDATCDGHVDSDDDKDDELSHSSVVTITSRSSLKSSQFDLNGDDVSKAKLSAQNSELFGSKSSDNVALLLKQLEEAHASIEFLENENQTLKEKTNSDAVEISKLEQSVIEFQKMADELKFSTLSERKALENREEQQTREFEKQMAKLTEQNKELSKKLSTMESEYSLYGQQVKMVSVYKIEAENQLSSMRTDLIASQDKVKQLEDKVNTLKNEKRRCEESLEREKTQCSNLQASLDSTACSMDVMNKETETLHNESKSLKNTIEKQHEDIRSLNEDIKQLTAEKQVNMAKLQTLVNEKGSIIEELEQTKKTLQETRDQHRNSELKIREVGQKLSAIECEAKEKAATIDSEERKVEMACKKNEEFKKHIQKIEAQLVAKDREITTLVLTKQTTEDKLGQLEEQLQKHELSKAQQIGIMTTEIGGAKAKNKQLHEQLLEREKALKVSERQITRLQCSLESEKEQKNTVTLKLTTLEEELASLKTHYQRLETHGKDSAVETEKRIQELKEVEESLRQQMKEKADILKLKEEESHSMAVNLRQAETELEKAKARALELETQVTLSMADVENHKKLCENFQSKLQLIQDSKHQEITELNVQLHLKRSEITKLSSKLDSVHIEMESLKQTLKESTEALEYEKNALAAVQTNLAAAENNGTELSTHLMHLEEQIKALTALNELLKKKQDEADSKISQQLKQIDTLDQNLKEATSKADGRQRKIEEMKMAHCTEMQRAREAKGMVDVNLQSVTEVLVNTQESLQCIQQKYEETSLELKKEQDVSNGLRISLETETESRNELAKKYTILETQHNESCSQLTETKMKLSSAKREIELTHGRLKDSQAHCESLEREVKATKEKTARSEEEMEQKFAKLVSQYEKEFTECKLSYDKLKETADRLSEEILCQKSEITSLRAKLEKGNGLNQQLKKQIAEDKAKQLVQKKKISELEVKLARETEFKVAMKQDYAYHLSKEHELQLKFDELRNKLNTTMASKESMESQLHNERMKVVSLQEDIKNTKAELKEKQDSLMKEKEMKADMKLSSDAELGQLKKKHHSEIRVYKDKYKDLQAELQLMKASCVSKTSAIDKLQALSDDLERGNRILQTQLDKVKKEWEEKSTMLKSAQVRNQGLEMQVARLQMDVSTLTQSQLEFEEFKKKLEVSSREELQRVLKEVTQHMEEQHTAHHYLEKLRKENESIALKEKDRQIDQLKTQLKRKKQELKKDKLHIESLEIESRFLKSQQKDNSNARHKLENHLGKISDALSISSVTSASYSSPIPARGPPIPHGTSTPIGKGSCRNKSFQ